MIDPLEKLVVSAVEIDRELLATTLADLVQIDKDSGEIRLTRKSVKLSKKLQILTYFLARKAAKALNLVPDDPISPKELSSKLGIGGGPLRGQLAVFSKERLIASEKGKYWIPNYAIEQVKVLLEQARGKEK